MAVHDLNSELSKSLAKLSDACVSATNALNQLKPFFILYMPPGELKSELESAVEREDYQYAAKLQKEIGFRNQNTFGL